MPTHRNKSLVVFARELRKTSTEAESLLWDRLRGRRLSGFKFRRQHVAGDYILDFYCDTARLAIELDGGGHSQDDQARYDEYRTSVLRNYNIQVLRFWNREVLEDMNRVLREIARQLRERVAALGRVRDIT